MKKGPKSPWGGDGMLGAVILDFMLEYGSLNMFRVDDSWFIALWVFYWKNKITLDDFSMIRYLQIIAKFS